MGIVISSLSEKTAASVSDTDEEPTVGLLTVLFNLLGTRPEILVCNVGRERWNTPRMEKNNADRTQTFNPEGSLFVIFVSHSMQIVG
jgi:hypothetical protein